jgi:hypothetical protein
MTSNPSHRGKGAWRDVNLVYKGVTKLHEAMRLLLTRQLPFLTKRIEALVPTEADLSSDDPDEED